MNNLTPTTKHEDKSEQHLALLAQKIDNTYKEGMYIYSEKLSQYALEIENIKAQINALYKAKDTQEQELKTIEKELDHEERFLKKLNETFNLKIHSIDELKTEYADLMEANEYNKILKRKTNELSLALDEIEEVEITLLQQELERINLLKKLNPKRQEISALKDKKLELEKEYFSLKKLHQLPQLSLESEEEITTEIIENDSKEAVNS